MTCSRPLPASPPDECVDMICVCQRVRTHATRDRRVKLRRAIHLVISGNVFRSITRTERAPCKLNMHSHTQQTCVSNDGGWGGWSAIHDEVIWLGVGERVRLYTCFCMRSALRYHLTIHTSRGNGNTLTLQAALQPCICVLRVCVRACVRMFLALAINSSAALRS